MMALIIWAADFKVFPLSDTICFGKPYQDEKCFKLQMNDTVVKVGNNIKMNGSNYATRIKTNPDLGICSCIPVLIKSGHAKSNPVLLWSLIPMRICAVVLCCIMSCSALPAITMDQIEIIINYDGYSPDDSEDSHLVLIAPLGSVVFNCLESFLWYKTTMMTDQTKDLSYTLHFAKTAPTYTISRIPTMVS